MVGVWYDNLCAENPSEAVQEIKDVAQGNKRCYHHMMHMIASWPTGEEPTREQVLATGRHILGNMGLSENQAVFALHRDTENFHLHIAVNRIGFDLKPVHAAGGWTKNSIQKSCRELELEFGWKIQHGGTVDVINGEVQRVNIKASVSKKARDFETFSGAQSEERKLKKICAPILLGSNSWEEAHLSLAKFGVKVKPQRSGGVLEVNGIEIKLSRIDRKCSWGNLISRLGEFKEMAADTSEILAESKKSPEVKDHKPVIKLDSWETYSSLRSEHYEQKRKYKETRGDAEEAFNCLQKWKFESLVDDLKKERKTLNETPMSGQEKNKQRKLLAFKQAKAMAERRKEQKIERAAFNSKWPRHNSGGRFPSYKEWLKEIKADKDLDNWRHRRKMGLICPSDDEGTEARSSIFDPDDVPGIVKYQPIKADDRNIIYYELIGKDHEKDANDLESTTSFADCGKIIKVFDESESSILASMQLGLAKWGKIKITGDAEFQQKCFNIALKNGIKLDNDEFLTIMEAYREANFYGSYINADIIITSLQNQDTPPALGVSDAVSSSPSQEHQGRFPEFGGNSSLDEAVETEAFSPILDEIFPLGEEPDYQPMDKPMKNSVEFPFEGFFGVKTYAGQILNSVAVVGETSNYWKVQLLPDGDKAVIQMPGRDRNLDAGSFTTIPKSVLVVGPRPRSEPIGQEILSDALAAFEVWQAEQRMKKQDTPNAPEPSETASSSARGEELVPPEAEECGSPSLDAAQGNPLEEGADSSLEGDRAEDFILSLDDALDFQERLEATAPPKPLGASLEEGFFAYHQAVKADRYRVTSIKLLPDGDKLTMILDKNKETKETIGFLPEELERRFPELNRLANKEENLYYTPLSQKIHHILIDDMDRSKYEAFINDGYKPCVLIESSPGNYQAILNVPKLEGNFDREVANRLTERLNREYGDQNLFGAIHPHRVPGTPNCKPQRRREDGTFPLVKLLKSEDRICDKAFERSKDIQREYIDAAAKQAERIKLDRAYRAENNIPATGSPHEAFRAHMDNIRVHTSSGDHSRMDYMIAVRMRGTGYSQNEIAEAITTCSPDYRPEQDRKKHGNFVNYGKTTAEAAFSSRGSSDLDRLSKYINFWLKLEGRSPVRSKPEETVKSESKPRAENIPPVPEVPDWLLEMVEKQNSQARGSEQKETNREQGNKYRHRRMKQ